MAKAGYKKQPTVWPTASFILIKFFQAVCCLLVLGVMGFFAFQLRNDHYPIPWQFISLAALSALSLLCVFVLGVFFCCRALNPMAAMVIEILLSILWAFGAGILGKGMGGNIIRACGVWRTPQGIAVCHLFKTVFAFCILGW
ncbi:hypothetical protein BDZ91DRAFT_667285 [Kalaharituber pfeilii]|nr:hypothetical protein BDZ91DRAFT_667285 [Kalaharituber pfeilii]